MSIKLLTQDVRDVVKSIDPTTAASLARDIAFVVIGGRPSFMLDYGSRNVTTNHLKGISRRAAEMFNVDTGTIAVVDLHGTYFVCNVEVLASLNVNQVVFVDVGSEMPCVLQGDDSRRHGILAAISDVVSAIKGGDTVDIGLVLRERAHAGVAPPTVAGVLLGYPVAYACEPSAMTSAANSLSSCVLTLHAMEGRENGEKNHPKTISGWTMPSNLVMDAQTITQFEAGLNAWKCRLASAAQNLGLPAPAYVVSEDVGRHSRVIF